MAQNVLRELNGKQMPNAIQVLLSEPFLRYHFIIYRFLGKEIPIKYNDNTKRKNTRYMSEIWVLTSTITYYSMHSSDTSLLFVRQKVLQNGFSVFL